jgi:hypothetical protein
MTEQIPPSSLKYTISLPKQRAVRMGRKMRLRVAAWYILGWWMKPGPPMACWIVKRAGLMISGISVRTEMRTKHFPR